MHTSTHCFFSQAVYILDILFMHLSVCLTKHMIVLTMQKAEPDRTPLSPSTQHMHAYNFHIFLLSYSFYHPLPIALIIMLLCNVS
jgi:hypothetical protein